MVKRDGSADRLSQRGPALTVSAVGHVQCARDRSGLANQMSRGSSFAAAIVAGYIAELLSRQKEGGDLRRKAEAVGQSFPALVRDHVVRLAYPRVNGGDKVVCNGILSPANRLGPGP